MSAFETELGRARRTNSNQPVIKLYSKTGMQASAKVMASLTSVILRGGLALLGYQSGLIRSSLLASSIR